MAAELVPRTESLRVMQAFNPWWSGKPTRIPPFRRLAYYESRSYFLNRELRRATLLSGPRRVGKTTILMQMAEDLVAAGIEGSSILYLSLDHPVIKLISLREALRIYHESTHPEDQTAFILLDEVQYSKEWETEVKLLVDMHPEYRILATGSASMVHHKGLAESGVGRWVTVHVPTLSFHEFAHMRGEVPEQVKRLSQLRPTDLFYKSPYELRATADAFRPLLPSFKRYLVVGGFPETALQEDIGMCQRLLREDVVERVLKRDMTALFGVRNVDELERLFIYLCIHTGEIFSLQNVAQQLGTTATTVANHLLHLEHANLLYKLPPYEFSGKKVLKARNKYYIVDAALRNAVLLKGEDVVTDPIEMGRIVETTILRHFYAYHYRETPRITYWRDPRTQLEVDIIVKGPGFMRPIEVKYREDAGLSPKSGVAAFCASEAPPQAFFVTKNDEDFSVQHLEGIDTEFLRVPAHVLCYLLGQAERLLWGTQD